MDKNVIISTTLNRIDDCLKNMRKCADGWTLPTGREIPCDPIRFSNYTKRMFEEIRNLPSKYFDYNDNIRIFHCEREALEDIAKESYKKNGDTERVVLKYLNEIENMVDDIRFKISNYDGTE